MFQYATGLSLAKKNRTALRLDTTFLQQRLPRRNRTYRDYDLDIFTLSDMTRLTSLSRAAQKVPIPGLWLGADFMGMLTRRLIGLEKAIRPKSDAFDPAILEKRGNLLLFDYWLSEKYFADVEDDLRKAFQFKHSLEGETKEIAQRIESSHSISLHVRRGDYVALKDVENFMGKTNLSYYERAVCYMNEHIKRKGNDIPTVFVFSDDIDWCKQNLTLSLPTIYLERSSAGPKASHHLQLMSLCRNNIIANSTFSWWGAWLNQNPEKIVVAPKRWFAHKVNEDVVPQRWITM